METDVFVSHSLLSTQHWKGRRTVFESQFSLGEKGILHMVASELPGTNSKRVNNNSIVSVSQLTKAGFTSTGQILRSYEGKGICSYQI